MRNFRSKLFFRAVRGRMGKKGENIPLYSTASFDNQSFLNFAMGIA
nr:MAG TPA: hypothetical protein [Caudoviricetes sp.]